MNREQQAFLEQLGARIRPLFDAIARGNVKSEFIIGVRCINGQQVRLKLLAELVDPGSNPLATHSQIRSHQAGEHDEATGKKTSGTGSGIGSGIGSGASRRRSRRR